MRERAREPLTPIARRETRGGLFAVFYTPRDRRNGRNPGLAGVADHRLLDAYVEGLEKTVRLLGRHGWARPKPDPESGVVEVYVGDLATSVGLPFPFTFFYYDSQKEYTTFIGLLSESTEVSVKAMLERAKHDALHEAVHAFTHVRRQIDDPTYKDWGWFDEGTAVFCEWDLYRSTMERMRFARDWVYFPERGVERKGVSVGYETAWFVEYLVARKGGWNFLGRIWNEAWPNESPVQTIDRLFRERGDSFRDAADDIEDFFGAGYCVDTYLTASLCPKVRDRYGDRLTRGCFELKPGRSDSLDETLAPMACHYYLATPDSQTRGFHVEIEGLATGAEQALKGRVFAVSGGARRGAVQPLLWRGQGGAARLACDVAPETGADYYLLVVANVLSVTDRPGIAPVRPARGATRNSCAFRVTVSA
jgi:hypothetical protein